MVAKAIVKFLRISPTKLRQVINLIKGKDVLFAVSILSTVNKQSRSHILKLLNSAIANAKQKGINAESLYISKITADPGPMWKRYRAAAFGRAMMIKRRTSHLRIELDLKTN